jgi:hypothetical protein
MRFGGAWIDSSQTRKEKKEKKEIRLAIAQ